MSKMQNIETILKEFGLEIPEDRREEFRVKFHENYKTVSDYGRLESDRDKWKTQAETAEETLKSFEGIDPEKIKTELDTWKQKAEEAEKNANKQIYERDFSDALKAELGGYKFTSEAAKRDVMSQIRSAELKLKDGKILGLSDLIEQIKKDDSSAFVDEQQTQLEQNRARFTTPMRKNPQKTGTMTKDEIMAIKDRGERRAAIREEVWQVMLEIAESMKVDVNSEEWRELDVPYTPTECLHILLSRSR